MIFARPLLGHVYYVTVLKFPWICGQGEEDWDQRTLMYKEAQADPSPSPFGFIRGECGSRTRIVCKILLQEQKLTHSEMVWGARDSVDLTRDRHLTDTPARELHSMFLIFFCIS